MTFNERKAKNPLPFGLDFTDIKNDISGANRLYPILLDGLPTRRELDETFKFSHFCDIINNSYYYTNDLKSYITQKQKQTGKYSANAIGDGIERFSDKYRRAHQKPCNNLNYYSSNLFPSELKLPGLSPSTGKKSNSKTAFTSFTKMSAETFSTLSAEDKQKLLIEKFNSVDDFDEEVVDGDEDDDEDDDEFEEEDDDDYNAEKYFDDGEFDDGDDDADDEVAF
uniref:DNA-directed RNA polymerase III subunit n=1 Tax=Ogataea thermomethanolica (nom. inval.) TaxID=310468 RepID=A0A5P8D2C7_9ASCO|nr:fatty acid synthase subunit alpha [Ogataea thermomethanolica (nom. inval.)]